MVRGLSTFFGSLFDGTPPEKAPAASDLSSKETNDRLRKQLRALGDDVTAPRPVRHFAIRATDEGADRNAMLASLSAQGFVPHGEHSDEYLGVEATAAVHAPEFDDLTAALARMLAAEGWRYDGWECPVVERGAAGQEGGRP